jgi:hypothetical protein
MSVAKGTNTGNDCWIQTSLRFNTQFYSFLPGPRIDLWTLKYNFGGTMSA